VFAVIRTITTSASPPTISEVSGFLQDTSVFVALERDVRRRQLQRATGKSPSRRSPSWASGFFARGRRSFVSSVSTDARKFVPLAYDEAVGVELAALRPRP